ncbi:neuronal acetylcholine receptor subunit beta-3-like [Ptychodera flava]|uniref:neuronal acetylcholine receptor subunit beta-3-like n=1 Tax=Ptychodera flava TaxID=63121 RepID=UPI00396AAEDC
MDFHVTVEMIWLAMMLIFVAFDQLTAGNDYNENVSPEERLHEHLFDGYSKAARPVDNSNDSVSVYLYLTLNQLIDVDEKYQIMTTRVWLHQEWNDTRLQWNPDDYDGLTKIVVTMDTIWAPDTALLNSADNDFDGFPRMFIPKLTTEIGYRGWVIQSIPGILRTPCTMDITYFPVDSQNCELRFGLWMYVNRQVQLILKREDVPKENFVRNSEWDIVNSRGRTRNSSFLFTTKEPYTDVIFDITIKRKPLYYAANLIIPCVLVNFLTVVVFSLPSDSSEKVNLSISLLLTLYVFSLLVAELLPPTSNMVPMLTAYLIFSMMLIAVSVSMTTLVAMLCENADSRRHVPHWAKVVFFQGIARILFIDVDEHLLNFSKSKSQVKTKRQCQKFQNCYDALDGETSFISGAANNRISTTIGLVQSQISAIRTHCRRQYQMQTTSLTPSNRQGRLLSKQVRRMRSGYTSQLEEKTNKIAKYMKLFLRHIVPGHGRVQIQDEWKLLVAVIDRLLLLCFALSSTLGASIMLSKIT